MTKAEEKEVIRVCGPSYRRWYDVPAFIRKRDGATPEEPDGDDPELEEVEEKEDEEDGEDGEGEDINADYHPRPEEVYDLI